MYFDFMKDGCHYAFHIRNKDELIAFSEAERDSIYDSLKLEAGGYLKDCPRDDIREWNLARWGNAMNNRYYDGSIYLTLYKHNEATIVIGWECHLEWLEDNGYEILEWSDYSRNEAITLPDLVTLFV